MCLLFNFMKTRLWESFRCLFLPHFDRWLCLVSQNSNPIKPFVFTRRALGLMARKRTSDSDWNTVCECFSECWKDYFALLLRSDGLLKPWLRILDSMIIHNGSILTSLHQIDRLCRFPEQAAEKHALFQTKFWQLFSAHTFICFRKNIWSVRVDIRCWSSLKYRPWLGIRKVRYSTNWRPRGLFRFLLSKGR
jgi:hypothetical protein